MRARENLPTSGGFGRPKLVVLVESPNLRRRVVLGNCDLDRLGLAVPLSDLEALGLKLLVRDRSRLKARVYVTSIRCPAGIGKPR
jgi:hypothetical protein